MPFIKLICLIQVVHRQSWTFSRENIVPTQKREIKAIKKYKFSFSFEI